MAKKSIYQSPDEILREALLEQAKRQQIDRQKVEFPSFSEWLPQASPTFTWDWPHLAYIQKYAEKVSKGEIKKLMVFVPPRHGKSEQLTIRYPVYELEREPSKRIVIAAYNATLAEKFSRKTRTMIRSRNNVPLNMERQSVGDWETKAEGGLRAVGVGGGITGMGANLIVIDDPVKSREEAESKTVREGTWNWFTDDLYTRQEPGCGMILQMTRWHHDDLAGRILAHQNSGDFGTDNEWVVISLPAICMGDDPLDYPEKREIGQALCRDRYDEKALLDLKNTLGSSFEALFQQRPTPDSGEVFKREWFEKSVNQFPKGKLTQVWDTAFELGERNDYSAMVEGMLSEDGILYVCAMQNTRMEFPELTRQMAFQMARGDKGYGVDVCVEDKATGKPARQTLRREGIPVIEIPAGTKDKLARAKSITNFCESGMVRFVNTNGNCNADLLEQLLHFPNGIHDDLADAFVHLLRRLTGGARAWTAEDLMKFNPSYNASNTIVGFPS